MADSAQSKSNIMHIRYFAEAAAINSSFRILYTAYREKGQKGNIFLFAAACVNLWVFRNLISRLFYTWRVFHPQIDNKTECLKDEYDCEDQTCIKLNLKCDKVDNCRFRWDEDPEQCSVSSWLQIVGGLISNFNNFAFLNPSISRERMESRSMLLLLL